MELETRLWVDGSGGESKNVVKKGDRAAKYGTGMEIGTRWTVRLLLFEHFLASLL